MPIVGILSQTQASDLNLATSVKQWLFSQVVTPYNTAAAAAGLNAGMSLQTNGTWKADTSGLGLIEADPDDVAIHERVPVIAYALDPRPSKKPMSTGAGDAAIWEYRNISVCCLPAITVSTDAVDSKIQPNRLAQWILRTSMLNAVTRANILPIVDHSAGQTGGVYPQIGYAEIYDQQIHSLERIKDLLGPNRYRFDVQMTIRWAVATTN